MGRRCKVTGLFVRGEANDSAVRRISRLEVC